MAEKTPASYFLDLMESARLGARRLMELDDRIVVWLVGISSGALALIIGHVRECEPVAFPVKAASVLLGLCIVLGIAHRSLFREVSRADHVLMTSAEATLRAHEMAEDLIKRYGDTEQLRTAVQTLHTNLRAGQRETKEKLEGSKTRAVQIQKLLVPVSQWVFYGCLAAFVLSGALLIWSFVLVK